MNAGVQAQHAAFGQFGQFGSKFAHPLMNFQRRADRAASVVLACLRIAEQGQQAVALHTHDHAAVARDGVLVDLAQRCQHGRVMLGLHALGQLGGLRQIGEEQREITPARLDRHRLTLRVALHSSPKTLFLVVGPRP